MEEETTAPESILPPPLPAESSSPEAEAAEAAIKGIGAEKPEPKKSEVTSVLPPPAAALSPPSEGEPAVSTESIAESYKFPSESEESPENQTEDSSLDAEAGNTEELKPPPF